MPDGLPPTPVEADAPLRICASDELVERGKGVRFDVMHFRERVNAFALRFDGQVVAYLNRCVHVPTELDWQPGEFLDGDREYILCAVHGAAYDTPTGRCVGGPCGRGRLTALRVEERGGEVYWYPSRDIRPAS
jgi:nitrite reductase/ring-hydroxylating ferredoxin subunit